VQSETEVISISVKKEPKLESKKPSVDLKKTKNTT